MDSRRNAEWRFYIHHLHYIFFAAAVFLIATTKILGLDIWWHLAVGRYLLKTWTFPARDVFSFTGGAWDNKEWLFGIFVYIMQRAGGIDFLTIVKAALYSSIFLVVLALSIRRSSNRYISLGVALLAAVACRVRLAFRPELVSFLFIAILLLLIDQYMKGKRKPLCFFPLLMLLWVNLHPLAILGLAIILIYIAGDVIARLSGGYARKNGWRLLDRRGFALLVVIFIACGVAFICNPISVMRFLSPFDLLTTHSQFLATLTEVKPLPVLQFPAFAAMLLLAAFTVVMFVASMEPADTIMLVGFGLLSVTMARNAPLLPICAAPIIASQLAGLWGAVPAAANLFLAKWKKVGDVLTASLLIVVMVWACLSAGFGLGYSGLLYPEGAVKYVEENSLSPRMFNIYDWGGFLIWRLYPHYKVFMDGRGPDVYSPEIWAEYQTVELGMDGWEKVLDKYGVNFMIISTGNKLQDLIARLNGAPEWRLVYWDFQSMLFLRDVPENKQLISAYEYKALDTEKLSFRFFVPPFETQIMSELYDFLKTHPDSLGGANLLAMSYLRKGQIDQAIGEFEKISKVHPRTPKLHYNIGVLYSQKGEQEKAFGEYEKEIAIDPKFSEARNNAGRILFEKGDLDRAKKYFKEAIRDNPRSCIAINNLGMVYLEEERIKEAIAEFKKALDIEPDNKEAGGNLSLAEEMLARPAETHNSLGQLYYSRNNLERAETQFKKALEYNPKYTIAIGNLGIVYMRKGRYEEAKRQFNEVLRLSPEDAAARQNLAILEEMIQKAKTPTEGR